MPFADDMVATDIRPDGLYALTRDVIYAGHTDTFLVPAGFLTDLASVPRIFRALIDVAGRHDRAAIVHDWLCEQLAGRGLDGQPVHVVQPVVSPVDVDGIFRRILHELGVGRLMRNFYWAGVRWGALGSSYRRAGWLRSLPRLLAVTLPLLPLLVPYIVVVSLVSALIDLLGMVVDAGDRPAPAVDHTLTARTAPPAAPRPAASSPCVCCATGAATWPPAPGGIAGVLAAPGVPPEEALRLLDETRAANIEATGGQS